MLKNMLIPSLGLALFIVCPRMAAMVYIVAKNSAASLISTALLGSIGAIPLILIMVMIFAKFGLWGALAFCVLTDLGAALVMKQISIRAGIETFIVALFVIIGVKVAPYISNMFIK
jgi:hypothetical protein